MFRDNGAPANRRGVQLAEAMAIGPPSARQADADDGDEQQQQRQSPGSSPNCRDGGDHGDGAYQFNRRQKTGRQPR